MDNRFLHHYRPNGIIPVLAQGRKTSEDDVYYVSHIAEDEVQRYNAIIRNHAEEFVILNW